MRENSESSWSPIRSAKDCRERLCKFSLFHLIAFIFLYLCLGAVVFGHFESNAERKQRQKLWRDYNNYIERNIVNVSSSLVELDVKSRIRELNNLLKTVVQSANGGVTLDRNQSHWEFPHALFFVTSTLLTVGYGNTSPLSTDGKLWCTFYLLIGLPLILLMYTALVFNFKRLINSTYVYFEQSLEEAAFRRFEAIYPALLAVTLFCILFIIPAACYSLSEPNWTYLESFYFTVISLTTTGLGDFVPGESSEMSYEGRVATKLVTVFYLLFGAGTLVCLAELLSHFGPVMLLRNKLFSADQQQHRSPRSDRRTYSRAFYCGTGNAGRQPAMTTDTAASANRLSPEDAEPSGDVCMNGGPSRSAASSQMSRVSDRRKGKLKKKVYYGTNEETRPRSDSNETCLTSVGGSPSPSIRRDVVGVMSGAAGLFALKPIDSNQ